MSHKPYLSLGDAIKAFLDKHGLKEEVDIQSIIRDWESLMGAPIAQNTEKMWFNKGIMYIRMSSPIWKNELHLARTKIKEMINKRVGQDLVQDVRIL
ncbi:MAG: DUF721 domain-containing protein [Bacteroidota bacterium]